MKSRRKGHSLEEYLHLFLLNTPKHYSARFFQMKFIDLRILALPKDVTLDCKSMQGRLSQDHPYLREQHFGVPVYLGEGLLWLDFCSSCPKRLKSNASYVPRSANTLGTKIFRLPTFPSIFNYLIIPNFAANSLIF